MAQLCFLCFFFIFFPSPAASQPLYFAGFQGAAASTNLTLTDIAEIQPNGILKLTNDTSRLQGHAFYTSPVRFKNSSAGKAYSFSAAFAIAVVPEYPTLGGHGLAFTIAPSKNLRGLPSQYLGLLNATDVGNFSNHLFAVEFDTVQDFEFGDINDNHVGINLNSMVSNASTTASYFADDGPIKRNLTLKSGSPIQAWIDYDSSVNTVTVALSPFSTKPKIPILSFHVDLSPILHEFMYVGFSASTGLLASSHYVLGWSFSMNGPALSLDLSSLPSVPGPKRNRTGFTIGVSVAAVLIVLIAISVAVFIIWKIKTADFTEAWELEIGPHRYSYKELKQATKRFRDKDLLGRGGFGKVYKGVLPNSKTHVAVKRISHESKQGLREFVSEIASIGRLRHRNLVQLLGWCRRRGDLLLVYEFMANGSLDNYIFDDTDVILSWDQRFRIIKGVASGLLYLHEGYEQVVIHRDIKASNVLLDSEMNGKLGDFGLARLYEHGTNPSTTRVVGTLGYLAPELPRTGKSTTSSDVYALGALLLEVACGRRPIDPKVSTEELVLVDWVWEKYREGKLVEVMDPKLNGDYNVVEAVMDPKLNGDYNVVAEEVNQGADIEIINMERHDGPFDDSSVSSQNHGDHEVTEFEEIPKPGISSSNPKFGSSFGRVDGSKYGDLNGVNAEINEQDDAGENKFSTFVGDEPKVEIKQDVNNVGMSENTPSEAMELVPKQVKKTSKSSSGSQRTLTPKMISKRETEPSNSLANIRQSWRNISGGTLKSPEKVCNKSKREPSHTACSEAHSSKTATLRTHAVRIAPKVEDSKVLKGRPILGSRSGEKVQTSGVSHSSPTKLESRSYLKTTNRNPNNLTVNSAIQDREKRASASNFRSTDLAERRKQGKADSEIKKLQKNLDIRSKQVSSSYGAVRPESDGKKAVLSSTKVRNTLRKPTTATSSLHSQLRRHIGSSASEAPNTPKNMSCRSDIHVEASDNSSCPSVNQECISETVSESENKRRKDIAKKKEPNAPTSRVSDNCRMSRQVVDGKQKVGARRSMNLTGRRDTKGVAASGMGRYIIDVTS